MDMDPSLPRASHGVAQPAEHARAERRATEEHRARDAEVADEHESHRVEPEQREDAQHDRADADEDLSARGQTDGLVEKPTRVLARAVVLRAERREPPLGGAAEEQPRAEHYERDRAERH